MDNQRVHTGFVDGRKEVVGLHSGQNQASATGLTILPVKVKAKGTDQMIQTYAFVDKALTHLLFRGASKPTELVGKEDHIVINNYGKGEKQNRLLCC